MVQANDNPATRSDEDRRTSIGARRNPASQKAIMAAAESILREDGLAGFSIEAVARRAKAGKPTIYRWWPSRTALLLDVYQEYKKSIAAPDTGTLKGDLEAYLTNQLVGFWQDRLCGTIFRFVIAEAQSDANAAKALQDYALERRQQSAGIIERAKERGEIDRSVNSELVVEMLASFAWHRLLTGRIEETSADIEQIVALVMNGIQNADGT